MRRTGPIGMQPCVSPVATATSGASSSPDMTGGAERAGVVAGRRRSGRRAAVAGSVVRHQPADQKGAARGGGVDGRAQQVGAARIAVNQRERRRDGLDPAGVRSRQIGGRVVGRAEQAEAVGRQVGEQQGGGRAVIDLASGGADAEPDPADPGGGAGRLGQLADELRQGRAGRLADIQHAERGALSFGQLAAQLLGEGRGIALGEGGGETGAHDRSPSSLATSRRDALDDQRPRRARSGGDRPAD